MLYADSRQRIEYIDSIRGQAEYSFIDDVPDPKFDGRIINEQFTRDKKDFLSDRLGVDINVKDGPASADLIHKMRITLGANSEQSGIEFDGVKVVVRDRGKPFVDSEDKTKKISNAVKDLKN